MGHQPPATSHQRRGIVPLILSAIFLWTVITSYPYQWAAENLARGWHTLAGDLLVRAGQPRTAADAYARAADAQDVPEPLLRRGAALLAAGDVEGALGAYRAAWRRNPIYEPAAARLGDLLRTRGQLDEARAAFDAPFLDQQRMVDWSWRELHPTSPEMIDIGGGLDYGFIGGMYQAEPLQGSDARWTEPQAWLRVSGPGILHLRLAAARPDTTSLPVQICAGSQCATFLVSPAWRTYSIAIAEQGTVLVEIRAPAYQAPDGRVLGVMIDSTAVERSKT
jgi:tetratricopeptide (TPR) repeat protein